MYCHPELQEVKVCANQLKKRQNNGRKWVKKSVRRNILSWNRYWAWYQGSNQQTNALCPAGQAGWKQVHLCITGQPEGSRQSCGSLQTNRITLTGDRKQPQGMGEGWGSNFLRSVNSNHAECRKWNVKPTARDTLKWSPVQVLRLHRTLPNQDQAFNLCLKVVLLKGTSGRKLEVWWTSCHSISTTGLPKHFWLPQAGAILMLALFNAVWRALLLKWHSYGGS